MPVEQVWNFAKQQWRKEVLKITNFKHKARLRQVIEKCIMSVPTKHLLTHVNLSRTLM